MYLTLNVCSIPFRVIPGTIEFMKMAYSFVYNVTVTNFSWLFLRSKISYYYKQHN